MDKIIVRSFCIDSDICEVVFRFDEATGKYLGDYPDFEEYPRFTKNGHPWITATQDSCNMGKNKYYAGKACLDCGSCCYFLQEKAGDLIGVCSHLMRRRQ